MHAHVSVARLLGGNRDLRTSPHSQAEFRVLPVVDGHLKQEPSISAIRIIHQETLKANAFVIGLLADGVVSACEHGGRYVPVSTSSTTLGSRSTKTALGTGSPAPVLEKKATNRVISSTDGIVMRPLTVRLSALFETVQLPGALL